MINNKINSFQLENIRHGYDFFEFAEVNFKRYGKLHNSFCSSFVSLFESIKSEFTEHILEGDLGILYIQPEYLASILLNKEEFMNKFERKCIDNLTNQIFNSLYTKQLKSVYGEIEISWVYVGARLPNEFRYILKIHEYEPKWQIINGIKFYEDKEENLDCGLERYKWFPE